MKTIIQKFGGTSLRSLEHIKQIAKRVIETKRQGNDVILVVSAMAQETDRLLNLCSILSQTNKRSLASGAEVDVVTSTGEALSAGLMALAIHEGGEKARSFLGYQLPILTNSQPKQAQITSLDPGVLLASLQNGEIPVVAGFQGIDPAGRITTLGRGGSDTTAVAIAAAISGSVCEIYTDVDGVYTADPRLVPTAKPLPHVSYRFMIEASELGAKVMHDRSVILGDRYDVPIKVLNTFSNAKGTIIGEQESHSRCIAVHQSTVSVVGDFIERTRNIRTKARKILRENGIQSFDITRRDFSFTSILPEADVIKVAHLFHRTYVENVCLSFKPQ